MIVIKGPGAITHHGLRHSTIIAARTTRSGAGRDCACGHAFVRSQAARAGGPVDARRGEGTTAFLVILAMTLGLILPRLLFGHLLPVFE